MDSRLFAQPRRNPVLPIGIVEQLTEAPETPLYGILCDTTVSYICVIVDYVILQCIMLYLIDYSIA